MQNKNESGGASTNPSHFNVMNAEADRLRQFTANFPHEVAKAAADYTFGPKQRASAIIRGLTENAISMFVASYLTSCDYSLVRNQLLISCPSIDTQIQLMNNLQCLKKKNKLVELLDNSGLEGVDLICLIYPVGGSKEPNMAIFHVKEMPT